MTDKQKEYYNKMLKKNRLMPIIKNKKIHGVISFYIGSIIDRYVRDDPWTVLEDEPTDGTICFVDQLITDKHTDNPKVSFCVWKTFRNHIKKNYPQVRLIRWNRVKNGVSNVYYYSLTRKKV